MRTLRHILLREKMTKSMIAPLKTLGNTKLEKHKLTASKQLLLNLINNISTGRLTIKDSEEEIILGQSGDRQNLSAEVIIHNQDTYRKMILGGILASGESYIEGDWDSSDLVLVTQLFSANVEILEKMRRQRSLLGKVALTLRHFLSKNSIKGSKRNIAAHYDLGNDFFELFLDQRMMYSSAIFSKGATNLDDASRDKLETISDHLQLSSKDHLLEIGTGWGGMAIYAAEKFGCKVTTTTISEQQFKYTCNKVAELGLSNKVTVLLQDYRNLKGKFDKLVSIEMIEAVGDEFFGKYFACCSQLLKPNGRMVIQAITIPDQRYQAAVETVDFIKRYIFPGGCLPSIGKIAYHVAKNTDMRITHLEDITGDYASTLAIWRNRFLSELEKVQQQGFDQKFIRMWEFYLAYCEGGFRERIIGAAQICFDKPNFIPLSTVKVE